MAPGTRVPDAFCCLARYLGSHRLSFSSVLIDGPYTRSNCRFKANLVGVEAAESEIASFVDSALRVLCIAKEELMPIGELAIRQVVVASRETSVLDAAKLMRQHHVGDVVITDQIGGRSVPVGIVTDRDLVLEVLAQEVDAAKLSMGDIITGDLTTVKDYEGVFQTIQVMRAKGARRIPVVDNEGALVGIVSVDDFVELLAEELGDYPS